MTSSAGVDGATRRAGGDWAWSYAQSCSPWLHTRTPFGERTRCRFCLLDRKPGDDTLRRVRANGPHLQKHHSYQIVSALRCNGYRDEYGWARNPGARVSPEIGSYGASASNIVAFFATAAHQAPSHCAGTQPLASPIEAALVRV